MILNAAASASAAPFSTVEAAQLASEPLPLPLLPHNFESGYDTCMVNASLRAISVSPFDEGWSWTDEGRGKWGWVSTKTGSRLRLRFSSMMHQGEGAAKDAASRLVGE